MPPSPYLPELVTLFQPNSIIDYVTLTQGISATFCRQGLQRAWAAQLNKFISGAPAPHTASLGDEGR